MKGYYIRTYAYIISYRVKTGTTPIKEWGERWPPLVSLHTTSYIYHQHALSASTQPRTLPEEGARWWRTHTRINEGIPEKLVLRLAEYSYRSRPQKNTLSNIRIDMRVTLVRWTIIYITIRDLPLYWVPISPESSYSSGTHAAYRQITEHTQTHRKVEDSAKLSKRRETSREREF